MDTIYSLTEDERDTMRKLIAAKLVITIGDAAKLREQIRILREALAQAIEQLEADYVHTPLDGHGALLRKLKAALTATGGVTNEQLQSVL